MSDDGKKWSEVEAKLRRAFGLAPPSPEEADADMAGSEEVAMSEKEIQRIAEAATKTDAIHAMDPEPDYEWTSEFATDDVADEMLVLNREAGEEDPEVGAGESWMLEDIPLTWKEGAAVVVILGLVFKFLAPIVNKWQKKDVDPVCHSQREKIRDEILGILQRSVLQLERIDKRLARLEKWHAPEGADQRQDWKGVSQVRTELAHLQETVNRMERELLDVCKRVKELSAG